MHSSSTISAFLALVTFIRSTYGSPLQARQDYTTTTTSCGPIITALASYTNPTAFCSSWLGITIGANDTVTEYTTTTLLFNRTVISVTATRNLTASSLPLNITAFASPIVVTEVVATSTLTFCNARFGKEKRYPAPQGLSITNPAATTPIPSFTGLPYFVQEYPQSVVSDACGCLSISKKPVTITSTRTALGDHVFVSGIIANATITPYYNTTVTNTPVSTTQVTLYATYVRAPSSTISPIYLPSPTPIAIDEIVDDVPYDVTLPFPVTFYDITTSSLSVSPNGWISLTPSTSIAFANIALPSWNNTLDSFSTAVLPFWDDLLIVNGSQPNPQSNLTQRLIYAIRGTAPDRTLTFEWVAGRFGEVDQHYRFWATFFEDRPNTVRFTYWDISDAGAGATVGAQGESIDAFAQYSLGGVDLPGIWPGLVLDFDSVENRFVPSSLYSGLC